MAITLLEMLLDAGLITPNRCDEALQNRVLFGGRIGTNLIELGFLQEDDLARFLSKKLFVPYVEPEQLLNLPQEIISLIPRDLALKYKIVPLKQESRRLFLVMADPAALTAIDEISFITGQVIRPLIAPEIRVIQALGRYYGYDVDVRYQEILQKIERRRSSEPPVDESKERSQLEAYEDDGPGGLEELGNEKWSRQLTRYTSGSVSRTLARADSRADIAEALVSCLAQDWSRVALFKVRGDAVSGWKATNEGEEVPGFALIHIPLNRPSVLKTVVEGRSYYLGRLADAPLNGRLLKSLGGEAAASALVMPLIVGNKVASILYVEGARRELGERVEEMSKLLSKAALAFEILIARDKILMT